MLTIILEMAVLVVIMLIVAGRSYALGIEEGEKRGKGNDSKKS